MLFFFVNILIVRNINKIGIFNFEEIGLSNMLMFINKVFIIKKLLIVMVFILFFSL